MIVLNERHKQTSSLSSLSDGHEPDFYTRLSMMNKQDYSFNVTDVASTTASTCMEERHHQTNHNQNQQQRQLNSFLHNSCHQPHNRLLKNWSDYHSDDSNSRANLVRDGPTATLLPLSSQTAISGGMDVASRMPIGGKDVTTDNDRRQPSTDFSNKSVLSETVGGRKRPARPRAGRWTRRCATLSRPLSSSSSSSPIRSSIRPFGSVISLIVLSVVLLCTYQTATTIAALAERTTISGDRVENNSSKQNSYGVEYEFEQAVNSTSGSQRASRVIVSRSPQGDAEADDELSASTNAISAPDVTRNSGDAQKEPSKPPAPANMSDVFETILKKRPYSKYWTVEQKWDDLFRRLISVQGTMRQMMMKNIMRDIEYYTEMTISAQCQKDIKFMQNYSKKGSNFRWMAHMLDATGKSEPGMLTGMMAHLGHPVQCIKVRAPARPTNDSFDERYFEKQTEALGERFRGKYCVASLRPVMPRKPHLVSRFSSIMNESLLSNISYSGESSRMLKLRANQVSVPASDRNSIDRQHLRLDQVPFESELYNYLIEQRNLIFTLPRFMGVCYPSSCSREDIRSSLQRTLDDQHQVVDIEFECEQEEISAWDWFITPRLFSYVLLGLVVSLVFWASLTRFILLSKMKIRRATLAPDSRLAALLNTLDMFSMDKCAGILFVKTKQASTVVDWSKVENNRSTSIDALKGFLMLVLVYSQLTVLGCLPLPFMWAKWSDAMFPFFRSAATQPLIGMSVWTEAFYIISAYLIALKCFENQRPKIKTIGTGSNGNKLLLDNGLASGGGTDGGAAKLETVLPNFFSLTIKRYVRLVMPLAAFILFNYIWPRLSNGFVFQDQASKLMRPCDTYGWTNMLLFHNHNHLNETCLWPSHVSATFFQLHLLSYPLLALCLVALYVQFNNHSDQATRHTKMLANILTFSIFGLMAIVALAASVYSALQASQQELIVPFLIDYLDFDNYRRVLEWTVMPTYNHVTSYMFGLALAFIVIRRKAQNELDRLESRQWLRRSSCEQQTNCDSSLGSQSARSSSTQELQDGLTFKSSLAHANRQQISSAASSVGTPSQRGDHDDSDDDYDDDNIDVDTDASLTRSRRSGQLWRLGGSLLSFTLLIACSSASWLWNGFAQPMSSEQTFWYVLVTKLGFCLAFAHLFHEHCATRRNSTNPWMITRFLVPIGRMSLTLFYMSWLVTWFDLLASLHQWHPSHYFIAEKYNEIIFIALIVSMFVYGAFEGIIKSLQYAIRLDRVKHDTKLQQRLTEPSPTSGPVKNSSSVGVCLSFDVDNLQARGVGANRFKVKSFESFFHPIDMPKSDDEQARTGKGGLLAVQQQQQQQQPPLTVTGDRLSTIQGEARLGNSFSTSLDVGKHLSGAGGRGKGQQKRSSVGTGGQPGGDGREAAPVSGESNLSPSDIYKLNAELRANTSFASIGLYENAGATGDLTALNSSDPADLSASSKKH